MFDDAKWKALNDNWRAKQELAAAQRVTRAPVNPKKKKGFLEDMVSTGGGIAGSLGGAAAGAAIGSAVPVVGTAIGGLIGAVLGGGLGSAGGEIVENVSAGEDWDKNVLSEGAFGAATSLPFGAGFKLLKAGAQGVRGVAGREVAKDLVQQAGLQTIGRGTVNKLATTGQLDDSARAAFEKIGTMPSLSQKAAKKASDTADDMALKSFKINDSGWIDNFTRNIGEDPGSFSKRFNMPVVGLTKLNSDIYKPMQEVYTNAVSLLPSLNKSEIATRFKSVYEPLVKDIAPDNKKLGLKIKDSMDSVLADLPDTVSASDVQKLKGKFDSLVNEKMTDSFGVRNNDINKRIADTFRDTLYAAFDKSPVRFEPGKIAMGSKATNLRELGKELQGIKEFTDKATTKINVGRGKSPFGLNLTQGAIMGMPGGPIGTATGIGLQFAVNSQPGRKTMFKTLNDTGAKLNGGTPKAVGQSLTSAISRMGTLGTTVKPVLNGLTNENQSSLPSNTDANATMTTATTIPRTVQSMDLPYAQDEAMSSPFGVSQEEIGQAMVRAMYSGDKEAFSQLKQMYDITEKAASANNPKSKAMGVEAVKNMNNASAGMSAINDLEAMINQDSGVISRASLPDIAPLNGLLGTSQYRAAIKDAQDTLSRLRSGASMTEQESQRFDQMLPRLGDDPETIQYKINRFREYYNSFINNPAMAQPTQNIPVGM